MGNIGALTRARKTVVHQVLEAVEVPDDWEEMVLFDDAIAIVDNASVRLREAVDDTLSQPECDLSPLYFF